MSRIRGIAVATALLATIASTLSAYPHQLAYFNEAAGGPENGHKHLLGSNLDWGQDLWLLRRWMAQKDIQERSIVFEPHTRYPARVLFRHSYDVEHSSKEKSYLVTSLTRLLAVDHMHTIAVSRIGYGMLIFRIETKACLKLEEVSKPQSGVAGSDQRQGPER